MPVKIVLDHPRRYTVRRLGRRILMVVGAVLVVGIAASIVAVPANVLAAAWFMDEDIDIEFEPGRTLSADQILLACGRLHTARVLRRQTWASTGTRPAVARALSPPLRVRRCHRRSNVRRESNDRKHLSSRHPRRRRSRSARCGDQRKGHLSRDPADIRRCSIPR
jgi:hypothetical protein